MKTTKAKPMPSLKSDADAERFVETADLSQYDLSGFKPDNRIRLGDALAALGCEIGLTNEDSVAIEQAKHQAGATTPAEPMGND